MRQQATCGETGKLRYRDRVGALLALTRAGRTSHRRAEKDERRVYRCRFCNGWHLTAQQRRR